MSGRRRWGWPLVPLYRAGLAAQEALRGVGLARARRLGWPVISVGSVSAGGAGKTPLVMALAKLLASRGWTVDVLSRGYGRAGRGVGRVDVTKMSAAEAARQFGDEPTLMAQRTGLPVWVGADRFAAGQRAEEAQAQKGVRLAGEAGGPHGAGGAHGFCAHVLDDGMQHRGLVRNFELAVVTAEDLVDALLPAGNLREPLAALRRADAVAVREEELGAVEGRLRQLVGPDVPLWTVRRSLRFPVPLGVFGAGLRPLAFCALARPEGFAEMLARAGCGVVDAVLFPDHHRYGEADVAELIAIAKRLHVTGLVTTEKDAVKLSAEAVARLEAEVGPVMVVTLEAGFVYESPVVRLLETRLRVRAEDPEPADEVRSH